MGAGFTSRLPTSFSTWYGVLFWKFWPCQNSFQIWGLPKYQQWISKENPLILRKFRPNELPNEQEEEKTVRKNRALQNVKSEIEVLTLKTSRFENKYISKRMKIWKKLSENV